MRARLKALADVQDAVFQMVGYELNERWSNIVRPHAEGLSCCSPRVSDWVATV